MKIIAEIGVNHNGDIELAKKLIISAKNSGADFVKFQTYKTEHLVSTNAECAEYQKENNNIKQFEMLKKYELSDNDFIFLSEFSKKNNIEFISTPFDCDSVDLLEKINVPLYKISSGDINNFLLLNKIKKTKKPVIISTGMSNTNEIFNVVNFFNSDYIYDLTIMHCVSSYPTNIKDINLNFIKTLQKTFSNCTFGISDHSELYTELGFIGVALDCKYIEKHLTLDKNMIGPDHKSSLNPYEFKILSECVNKAKIIMGNHEKNFNNLTDIKNVTKRGVCAKYELQKDDYITFDNIIALRGENDSIGINDIYQIIGKKINCTIKEYQPIRLCNLY